MAGLVLHTENRKRAYWVRYIHGLIKKNKNCLGAMTGEVGSGKSSSSLSVAEQIDPNFTVNNVVFDLKGLMKRINSGELKPGSCIVYEEGGVSLNAKNWQSILSKVTSYLFQTWRHKNYVLIFTLPYIDLLDGSTRKMLNFEWRTSTIDYKKQKVIVKPKISQYNPDKQKYYRKWLRVTMPDGVRPLKTWGISKPSKELWEAYKKKKNEFTTELNLTIEREIERAEGKLEAQNSPKKKDLTSKQEEVMNLMEKHSNVDEVAEILGISTRAVYSHIESAKKKGYMPHKSQEIVQNEVHRTSSSHTEPIK